METKTVILLLALMACLISETEAGVYYQDKESYRLQVRGGGGGGRRNNVQLKRRKSMQVHKERKKDIFLSRGWGAGGMPFSVLYMSPTRATVDAAKLENVAVEGPRVAAVQQVQQLAQQQQVRPSPKNIQSYQHATIPQLFVSYNWAPIGKKK